MAIFRKVHVQFWGDVFIQSLTPEQKFFFLYLLTNEKTKQCGIYEITSRQISYDTGYNIDTINTLISFFENAGKILFSRETNEIAIKNWDRYNGSKSPDIQSLVNKELKLIKNTKLTEWVQSVHRVSPLSKSSLRGEPEEEPEREPEVEVGEIGIEKVREIANEVWKDDIWKEQICMGMGFGMDELKKWLALFNSSVASDNIKNFNKGTYRKMVRGWIVKQKQKGETVETNTNKKTTAPTLKRL